MVRALALKTVFMSALARSQNVIWQYPTTGLTFNHNDVIVASWESVYGYPSLYVWAPDADNTAVIEWMSSSTVWTNGTFAYTFSSTSGGFETYPFSAHFQILNTSAALNNSALPDRVDSYDFTITSTSGAPTTYAYLSTTVAPSTSSTPTANPATVSSFVHMGCYTDSSDDRTLRNNMQAPPSLGNMTLDNCYYACTQTPAALQANYNIFGTEQGDQCFCDIVIYNPAARFTSEDDCDSPCAGDSTTTCGGANRLDIYALGGTLPPWSTAVVATVASPPAPASATSTAPYTSISVATTSAIIPSTTASTMPATASASATTSIPTSSPTTTALSSTSSSSSSGLSTGAKAGIGVAVALLAIAAIIGLLWFLRRRQRSRNKYEAAPVFEMHGNTEYKDMKQGQTYRFTEAAQRHYSELPSSEHRLPELSAEARRYELETPVSKS